MNTRKTIYKINLPKELAQKLLALRDERPDLFQGVTIKHTPPSQGEEIRFEEDNRRKTDELLQHVLDNMNGHVRVTIDLERGDLQNTDILKRLLDTAGHRKVQIEAVK